MALGCALTPPRAGFSFHLGVWLADGLLIVAHILFLLGNARFVGRLRPSRAWAILFFRMPLAAWPADAGRTLAFAVVNASLVSGLALASAGMLLRDKLPNDWAAPRLAAIFALRGLFYATKAVLAWVPGGFVNITALKGTIIQLSLVEGIPIEIVLLLVMATSARRRREAQLVALAASDPLTGLLNKRAFDVRAQALLSEDARNPAIGALMRCDLDHCKAVNDTCGHAAGDQVLMAFAKLLRSSLPLDAIIARYGGDEFVALVPGAEGETLSRLGTAICDRFRATCTLTEPHALSVSVTIGTARIMPGRDLAALLADADAAAYEAKRRGRNQVVLSDAGRLSGSEGGERMPGRRRRDGRRMARAGRN